MSAPSLSRSNPGDDDGGVAAEGAVVAGAADEDGGGDGAAAVVAADDRGRASRSARTRWNSGQSRKGTPRCRNTPRPF